MTAFISRKQSLIILLAGLCTAAGIILLFCNLNMETRLNLFYDYLLKFRRKPPVSNEIVLIETGEAAEGGDVFDVLMALSEFNASSLVIVVPIVGISSDRTLTDEEIRQRLNDEYSLLGRNIRNFYDAIRMGLITSAESQYYIDNLLEIADRGKDRLAAFLLRDAKPGSILAARTSGVFDTVLEATDLGSSPPEGGLWYSRPYPDAGGKLRRIAPLLPAGRERTPPDNETIGAGFTEHIVYRALKPRWPRNGIEDAGAGQVLIAGDFSFPLDYNGNIMIEKLHDGDSFRSIGIEQFRRYAEADIDFRRLLKYAESLGAYSNLKPERIPLYVYDHAIVLLDELLEAPSPEKHALWLHARREYWNCLEEFLNGDSEAQLLGAYDRLITTETFTADGLTRLLMLRSNFVVLFEEMRAKYPELAALRGDLERVLNSSFCIMGPASPAAEASALLANTLLTGCCITPAGKLFVIFCSMAVVFFLLFIIHALRPLAIFIAGIIAGALCAAGFGWSFVITGYWLDPLIPCTACMAGSVVMFFIGFFIRRRALLRFRLAYESAVSTSCLKKLVKTGKPPLHDVNTAGAAVIAVRNSGLLSREDNDNPLHAAQSAAEFRTAVTRFFFKAGAVLIGCEGGVVLVCFGSPPERIYLRTAQNETGYIDEPGSSGGPHPVHKAAGFISALIREAPPSWCFGMDYGECAFSWSAETGFIANGRPVVRARILASLAPRYKARIIISNTVREKVNYPVRKLHVLGGTDTGTGEAFYELLPSV